VSIIHARSYPEAFEYILFAMGDCEHGVAIEETAIAAHGDRFARTYLATCEAEGIRREFTFVTDPVPQGVRWSYGYGPEPSQLIDAGGWFLVFSREVRRVRELQIRQEQAPDLETVEEIVGALGRAWAALQEILRFLPDGVEELPDPAFWTEQGRAVRREVPDEFSRAAIERLVAQVDQTSREYAARYAPRKP
jgi:hypothetical protein